MVPCSIWMPPVASGPVFTVSSPIRTGLLWAKAGTGTAASAALIRNVRRVSRWAMAFSLSLTGRSERRAFFRHPSPHRNVAELFEDAVDLGQHRVVGLMDVDRTDRGHPAWPARHPEHFVAIAFGIEEIAADGAGMIDDLLDAIPVDDQAAVERAKVVEAGDGHGDLLDQVRIRSVESSSHQRDLVVGRVGIGAQEDD